VHAWVGWETRALWGVSVVQVACMQLRCQACSRLLFCDHTTGSRHPPFERVLPKGRMMASTGRSWTRGSAAGAAAADGASKAHPYLRAASAAAVDMVVDAVLASPSPAARNWVCLLGAPAERSGTRRAAAAQHTAGRRPGWCRAAAAAPRPGQLRNEVVHCIVRCVWD